MRMFGALIVVAACGSPQRNPPSPSHPARAVSSNVLRGDYAGSESCADCHADIYKRWAASPMRNMTRDASSATIRAPFDGATLRVGTDRATMESEGGKRYVRVTTARGSERFVVTKVVGGRYREDFVGRAVAGDGSLGTEHIMPATFVFSTASWRYKGYSVMVKERPEITLGATWSQDCIACHNTLPLLTTLYDELYGPGAPAYQGKLADRMLPPSLQWTIRPRNQPRLIAALGAEIAFLGGEPSATLHGAHTTTGDVRAALAAAANASQSHLDGSKLVELGVGCEACHNGSRAHVADPTIAPSYRIESELISAAPPQRGDGGRAQAINQSCAKCHTVLFSRYPYTWENGTRKHDPGGSTTNSGEGRDYQLGGCARAMACTACHDPHTADPPSTLAALATPAGNRVCSQCHGQLVADVAAHSHHKPDGAGASCIGCHMAKKNMGLDYGLIRYHRIGSPTATVRVEGDRPLECALCHADKGVESLVATMEQWWGKRYDRKALRALYGDDLTVNPLRATVARGKPHEQAAAMIALANAHDRGALVAIASHLDHTYPLVRYFARRALETLVGAPVAIDVGAPIDEIRAATVDWLRGQRTSQ